MRRLSFSVLALAAIALLCGCPAPDTARGTGRHSGPTQLARPAPSPTPLRLSRTDIEAALPESRDLFPWRVQVRCIRRAECGELDHGEGRGAFVFGKGRASRGVSEYVLIAAIRWSDAARAERAVRETRADNETEYGGPFSRSPHRLRSGGYDLGEQGHGHVIDRSLAGWDGYERLVTSRWQHLDGRTTARFHEAFILMGRDRYTLQVGVRTLATRTGTKSATALAEELLSALVQRLDELGGASGGSAPASQSPPSAAHRDGSRRTGAGSVRRRV